MSTMLEHAQRHIASMVSDLEGDDDFMPFMTVNDRDTGGVAYVGIMMPQGSDEKNSIADIMTAICAIHRSTEAVYACTSWLVTCDKTDPEAVKEAQRLPPSQHPDRVEVVFLVAATMDGDRFMSANVIRQNNGVLLGEWSDSARGQNVGGRFGEALHLGFRMGAEFPPEMCDYVDRQIAEGNHEGVLASFLRATTTARAEMDAKQKEDNGNDLTVE